MSGENKYSILINQLISEMEVIILSLQNSSVNGNSLLREKYFTRIAEIESEIKKLRAEKIAAELDSPSSQFACCSN